MKNSDKWKSLSLTELESSEADGDSTVSLSGKFEKPVTEVRGSDRADRDESNQPQPPTSSNSNIQ